MAETGMEILVSGILRAKFKGSKFLTKANGSGYLVKYNDEGGYGSKLIEEFIYLKFNHSRISIVDLTPKKAPQEAETEKQ